MNLIEQKLTVRQVPGKAIPFSMPKMETQLPLIANLKKGDRAAQELFYRLHFSKMFPIAIRFSGSKEEAHEIINTAFMSVLKSIHTYKQGNFEGWISQIVRRTAIDYYRKYNYNKPTSVELIDYDEVTYNKALSNLQLEEILKMIQKLPPATRTVFNLFIFDEMTHEEVANKLDISVGTSKWHISKGRVKLTELFNEINQVK